MSEEKQQIDFSNLYNNMPILAKVNEDMSIVNKHDFESWLSGEITQDAIPFRLLSAKPIYAYVVKYPFCKPKVKYSDKAKNYLFSKNGIVAYYASKLEVFIQPRNINVLIEYDDEYYLNANDAKSKSADILLDEYHNIYK